jgi:hypothetical protein
MAKPEDVKDLLDSRREFTLETEDGDSTSYFIANPTGEDIRKADWQYSKIYNQAILDEFLTQAQMWDLLKKQNILSEEYAEEVEGIRTKLSAEIYKLEILPEDVDDFEKESVALEVGRLRDELFRLNQRVNGPMGNTCENLAEDARVEFLTGRIVQKKDGSRLWESFDKYRNEENTALSVKSRFEVMLWMQGLTSDFLENTPEQQALRVINQARIEEALKELEEQSGEEAPPVVEEAEVLELPESEVVENVEAEPVTEEVSQTVPSEKTEVSPKPAKRRGRPKGSKAKTKVEKETLEDK